MRLDPRPELGSAGPGMVPEAPVRPLPSIAIAGPGLGPAVNITVEKVSSCLAVLSTVPNSSDLADRLFLQTHHYPR